MTVHPYRYRGCGLENVYLVNGYRVSRLANGEEVVAIEDIEGLHRAISALLVDCGGPLTGPQFRFLRKELDMSQRNLGMLIGVEEQTVSLWERGKQELPQHADLLVRALTKETSSGHAELIALIARFNKLDREQREQEISLSFVKEVDDGWVLQAA